MHSESDAAAGPPPTAEQANPAPKPPLPSTPGWPPLSTSRLIIKQLTVAWLAHVQALNDAEHMRFSDQRRRRHSIHSQNGYIEATGPNFIPLDLRLQGNTLATVGTMSCHLDPGNKVVDLGIMVVPQECGKGYGAEAWRAVMNHWLAQGFKVEAGCMGDNYAMRDIMIDCGMVYEGMRQKHYLLEDGTRTDWVLYGRAP